MGAPLIMFLFFTAAVQNAASDKVVTHRNPHLTGCVSTNMETFQCRWNVGTFQNLSEPGDLRLFYMNKLTHALPQEWTECPHYNTDSANECFFNENHTSIWTVYSVQLRSRDQAVLYDERLFCVEDIVQPDPPFGLNWTVLNMSLTGNFYDVMLSWKPPQSADVEMGWMTLQYEVQYRSVNSDSWRVVDLLKITHCTLYGLQTNVDHEVHVRCKMLSGKEFGEFSDSAFIHIPYKVSQFPAVALLLFGALCLVAILMLVIISQQEKLMVILLPPVPGPKIRGIDPELLKKGKLRELTSILDATPDLRPELYNSDSWVEFIDLDIEEHVDRLADLDTDCLMDRSLSSDCSPLSIGFRDDDSGRASCCDPDLPSDPEASPFHPLLPNQVLSEEPLIPAATEPSAATQSATAGEPAPSREALYTQVSEVRASGKVLLSPEEQKETEKTPCKGAEKNPPAETERKREFQPLVVSADHGYTSELHTGKVSPSLSTENLNQPCQTDRDLSSVPSPSPGDHQQPSHESDTDPMSCLSPAPFYTVVDGINGQNSLLLTPNSTPGPQLTTSKTMPTPNGYLTPDLLGSITP
ncbi:growth hormone receptor-like [Aulostomus maculatus]